MKKRIDGHKKRIAYYVLTAMIYLLAVASCILMTLIASDAVPSEEKLSCVIVFIACCVVYVIFQPTVVFHELGHLVFGAMCRMKFVSVKMGYLRLSRRGRRAMLDFTRSGQTQMLPTGTDRLKGRMMMCSLGGSLFNVLYGAVFLPLFFLLAYHPALQFFACFAPLHLAEAACALFPVELPAGRTDGAVFSMLKRETPEAKVYLRVWKIQGILSENTFDAVDEALLFDVPVVREDEPAFLSLLQLRYEYALWHGDFEGAEKWLMRLSKLNEYLPAATQAEILCDVGCYAVLTGNPSAPADVEAARGTSAYARYRYALHAGFREECERAIRSETALGIRAFEERYLTLIEKKPSQKSRTEGDNYD